MQKTIELELNFNKADVCLVCGPATRTLTNNFLKFHPEDIKKIKDQ